MTGDNPVTEVQQERPARPPMSGPGSGVGVWREYAAAVTDSPVESWAAMSREEIAELLDSEGADQTDQPEVTPAAPVADDPDAAVEPVAEEQQPRPVWMVPTPDGMVPEHELRRRR